MAKLFRKHGLPGSFDSKRWKEPKLNKYWEKNGVRVDLESSLNQRLFGKTRINAKVLRMLFTALYEQDNVAKSRRRYREGMKRIGWMLNLPAKKVDKVLRADLKTVANRYEKFFEETERVHDLCNRLTKKFMPSGKQIKPEMKVQLMLSKLSLEEMNDYLISANLHDAIGHLPAMQWASLSPMVLEWLKAEKPLLEKKGNHKHNKGKKK
jgi:hypothetical protein